MITQFALVNEYEQSFELNNLQTGLLTNPSGMGYELDCGYTLLGSSWVQDYKNDKQTNLSGSIIFASSDPYKTQTELLKFIRASAKLKLTRTTSLGTYYKDVDITKYSFSRIKNRVLSCEVTMKAKSLWYLNSTTNYTISSVASDAMRYPYKFPATFKGSINGEISIINDGSVEAPFTVSFTGPIVNPALTLYQDETQYAKIDITGEAADGESIELSTIDGDLYCYAKKDSGNVNLTDMLDIENENFFKIPVGTSVMKLSSDGDITKPVIFTVRKLYRAV